MGQVEMLDLYLKCTAECMEGVQKLPSPIFNTKQCEYLADKLKVAVRSARSFLEVSRIEHHGPGSSVDVARQIETFKLMLVWAKEIESFILGCSKDAWIQAAMTLTNVSEYVASIGFNLELCRVAFCKERGATGCSTGRLTLDQVMAINDDEVRIVKEKALVDGDALFSKVLCDLTQKSLSTEEKDLAIYLLQRLKNVQAVSPCVASGSSGYSVIDDNSFLGNLFKWVSNRPERIGRGASAAVYKVMWLGTSVAKKTFEGRNNPDFMKEVEILAKLSHPNITSMFCCQKDKRSCSLVMELMDGDLHELMHKRCEHSDSPPFTIFEAVDIMLQIGEGVNYLHQKGVIHRDLKSHNILVKSAVAMQSEVEVGYVRTKVADFGLSKTKSVSTTYSNQTFNTGTFRWMAPEIIALDGRSQVSTSGQPRHPRKVDVYSFAMLCYEILTGDVPFALETIPRIIKQRILNGDRPHLPDKPDDCPIVLKLLIEECWDRSPRRRPSFPTICSRLKYVKYLLMAGKHLWSQLP